MFFTILAFMGSLPSELAAQKKWDGEGADGLWQNAVNWADNQLPEAGDKIMFDNSLVAGDYQVSLGGGTSVINAFSVAILPGIGRNIRVLIPGSNSAAPALTCTGERYGLMIGSGGELLNSSGAAAGATLDIADSIRIDNGGKYIHATPRSHADIVRILSRAAGTETGEFEFRIPVASSTISVSGQVFGKLRLSPGPGGTINYTGTGTNDLTVRSDLEIAAGVNLSFNLEGRLSLGRDLKHDGGLLNLGSTARKLQFEVGGNLKVATAATITETGSATPEIILAGQV
ncbi:MAG: hypothetical protein EOP49_38980, partial [Sphingobacteriales bacterium]